MMGIRIKMLSGFSAGKTYDFNKKTVKIGRDPASDLVLSADHDRDASRNHAEIVNVNDQYIIKDLGSSNGTLLNGKRVLESELDENDRIQFGSPAGPIAEVTDMDLRSSPDGTSPPSSKSIFWFLAAIIIVAGGFILWQNFSPKSSIFGENVTYAVFYKITDEEGKTVIRERAVGNGVLVQSPEGDVWVVISCETAARLRFHENEVSLNNESNAPKQLFAAYIARIDRDKGEGLENRIEHLLNMDSCTPHQDYDYDLQMFNKKFRDKQHEQLFKERSEWTNIAVVRVNRRRGETFVTAPVAPVSELDRIDAGTEIHTWKTFVSGKLSSTSDEDLRADFGKGTIGSRKETQEGEFPNYLYFTGSLEGNELATGSPVFSSETGNLIGIVSRFDLIGRRDLEEPIYDTGPVEPPGRSAWIIRIDAVMDIFSNM